HGHAPSAPLPGRASCRRRRSRRGRRRRRASPVAIAVTVAGSGRAAAAVAALTALVGGHGAERPGHVARDEGGVRPGPADLDQLGERAQRRRERARRERFPATDAPTTAAAAAASNTTAAAD
ncbi:unnamed protein product, partial [Ectocarpus sp. 12 AP-2014]